MVDTPNTTPVQESGTAQRITPPAKGASVTIPVMPGQEYVIDAKKADFAQDGSNLVIKTPDDGDVVLQDYFMFSQSDLPPQIALDDGQVIDPARIMANIGDPDLNAIETAAGGGGGGGAGGGGAAFSPYGPGDIGTGLNTLDLLGNLDMTFGLFTVDAAGASDPAEGYIAQSDLLGGFGAIVSEDLKPNQNTGDQTLEAASVRTFSITFVPNDNEYIDNSLISGFTAGVQLTLNDGAIITFTDSGPVLSGAFASTTTATAGTNADGTMWINLPRGLEADIEITGLPKDSDVDIPLTAAVTIRDPDTNHSVTLNTGGKIIIDAVADQPEDVDGVVKDSGNDQHWSEQDEHTSKFEGGYNKLEDTVAAKPSASSVTSTFTVTATFGDYEDGSEQHYVLVEKQDGFSGGYPTVTEDGVEYFVIHVNNADIQAGNGTVSVDVTLTTPPIGEDTTFDLQTGAMAVETPSDNEPNPDNNVAFAFDLDKTKLTIDVVDSTLNVKVGWASEGNAPDKNLLSGSNTPDYTEAIVAGSTNTGGAPIDISLSDSSGAAEVITQVVFTYDSSRGDIVYTGSGAISTATAGGVTTVTISGLNASNLGSDVTFKPATSGDGQYSDADVELNYTVTVKNTQGAQATYEGTATVVIDSVADLSTDVESSIDDGLVTDPLAGKVTVGGTDAASPDSVTGWETDTFENVYEATSYQVKVTVETSFPDVDGSEKHYVLVEKLDGWTLDSLPDGYSDAGIYEGSDGKDYFKIEVDNSKLENVSVEITLKTEAVTGDKEEVTIKTGSLAVETADDDREYDTGNNQAERLDGTELTYEIDVINSTLTVETGWASEGNNDAKHIGGLGGAGYTPDSTAPTVAGSTSNTGAPINISIAGSDGSAETITEVVFTYDASRGDIVYTGTDGTMTSSTVGGVTTVTITGLNVTDLSGIIFFEPPETGAQSYNDADVALTYKVTVENENGASTTFSGSSTIAIDAVADLSTKVESTFDDGTKLVTDTEAGTQTITGTDKDGSILTGRETSGYEKDVFQATNAGSQVTLTVKVATTFPDTDGSETHYILVEQPTTGWTLGSLPPGYSSDGTTYVGSDGKTYFKIEVDDSTQGTVSADIEIISPTGYGAGTVDTSLTIKTGSLAVETDTSGIEYDTGNNTAVRLDGDAVTYKTDVVNSKLTVLTGWASEGGDDSKHIDGTSYNPSGGVFGSTSNGVAPVSISIAGGAGSTEYIQSVTITYDEDRGTLYYNGNPVTSGTAFTTSGTTVSLTFKPATTGDASFDYSDVGLSYEVTVSNGAGASATFSGTSTVVIDAVADKPKLVIDTDGDQIDYLTDPSGDEYESAKPGDTVTLHGDVTFPDASGGEAHAFLFKQATNGSEIVSGTLVVTDADGGTTTYQIKSDGSGGFEYSADGGATWTAAGTVSGGYYAVPLASDSSAVVVTLKVEAGDSSASVEFGGRATVDDSAGTGGIEYDTGNNASTTTGTIGITVDSELTAPSISIGSAYENAAGDANLGAYRPDGADSFWSNIAIANGAELSAAPTDATDQAKLAELQKNSAQIKIEQTDTGEFVSGVKIAFDSYAGLTASQTGQFMLGNTLISLDTGGVLEVEWNGATLLVECETDPVTGRVTLTIMSDKDGADLTDIPLYFVPGDGNSHIDVDFDVAISVTNQTNEYTQTFYQGDSANEDGMVADLKADLQDNDVIPDGAEYIKDDVGVVEGTDLTAEIDAVAAKPEFDLADVKGAAIDGTADPLGYADDADKYYDKIVPGSTATITLNDVNLHGDTKDGSESHYLLVQQLDSYTLASVVLDLGGGVTIIVSADAAGLQAYNNVAGQGGGMFYMIDLDKAIDAYNSANGTTYDAGDIDSVDVNVTTPSGATGSQNIIVGLQTSENWGEVVTDGDKELRTDNNNSFTGDTATISYSSVTTPGIGFKAYIFENATPNANTGDLVVSGDLGTVTDPAIKIDLNLGGGTDMLTGFSLAVSASSQDLGSLYLFTSQEAYAAYQAAVAGGADPWVALETYATQNNSIDFDDISSLVGTNSLDQLTGAFTGVIVYIPSKDSYSGQDPQLDYKIDVMNVETGQTASTGNATASITADAVAQKPDTSGVDEDAGNVVMKETVITKTVTVEFQDSDSSTQHYILIEALPGWTVSYMDSAGVLQTFTVSDTEVFVLDGTVYYKIPVDPTFTAGSHEGTASVDITLTPPSNLLYWNQLEATATDGRKPFEITVGGLSIEEDTSDGEITYHNNVAIDENGSITGTLDRNGTTPSPIDLVFEQTSTLYEDNQPNQNTGDTETEQSGTFLVGAGTTTATTVEITVPVDGGGNPLLDISGPGVSGPVNGVYTVTLNGSSTTELEVKLSDYYPENSDEDLSITYVFKDGSGNPVGSGTSEVIVDAVADLPQDVDVTIRDDAGVGTGVDVKDDAVAGTKGADGADSVAKFIVTAEFTDTDGSESHYILVEKVPSWQLAASGGGAEVTLADGSTVSLPVEEIYLDGKTYYRIDVTGQEASGTYELGLTYVGMTRGADDDISVTGGGNGVIDFALKVGAMSQEKNVTDQEADFTNNTAVVWDNVTLKYSPIDSTGQASVTTNIKEGDSATIAFTGIATTLSDELTELTVTVKTLDGAATGGALNIVDASGNVIATLTSVDGGVTYEIPDAYLDELSSQTYKLEVVPSDRSHEDIKVTWEGKVSDTVSLAEGTISGGATIVIDAVADGSANTISVTDASGGHAAVMDGENATITVEANFVDNVNASEEHWVVVQQASLDYGLVSVTLTADDGTVSNVSLSDVVTKYDADGNAYFAVLMPDEQDYKVEFVIKTPSDLTSDTSFDLKAGTITIETTKNSADNAEPSYSNNWKADLETVTVHTGVVETTADDITVTGAGDEDGYCVLTFPTLDTDYNESLEIIINAGDLQGGTLYVSDGAGGWDPVADVGGVYTLDGSGTYAYKPAENVSGTVAISYEAKVTDDASGATESFAGKSAVIAIAGVADAPTSVTATVQGDSGEEWSANRGDHTASVSVLVSATFAEDSNEQRFFLVEKDSLPEGLTLDGTYTEENINGVNYYVIDVTNSGTTSSTTLTFTADSDYAGGSPTILAGVQQNTVNGVAPSTEYALSDTAVLSLPTLDADLINAAPEGLDPTVIASGWDLSQSQTYTGTMAAALLFSDVDGDAITLVAETITGAYGTLTLNANGTYSYALNSNQTLPANATESFTITGKDVSGEAATSTVTFEINNAEDAIIGSSGADTMIHTVDDSAVYGGAGADVITITGDGNTVHGGEDADVITVTGDDNIVYGDDGADKINIFGDDNEIYGGDGDDEINVTGGGNTIHGGAGNDEINLFGSEGNTVFADSGNNVIDASGSSGDNTITGGSGYDTITGGDGVDTIYAGSGGSKIYASEGDDQLHAGDGADVFVYQAMDQGGDTIFDFSVSGDQIDLDALFENIGATSVYTLEESGANDGTQFTLKVTDSNDAAGDPMSITIHTSDVTSVTDLQAAINGGTFDSNVGP